MITSEMIDRLQAFSFTFEVRDVMSPNKDQVIGFCRLPTSMFAKVSQSMSHFTDDNVYPIVGHDGLIEIKDLTAKAIGWLKVTIAFGTAHQVNNFVHMLDEREKAKERTGISTDQTLARERMKENEDTLNRPLSPREVPKTPQLHQNHLESPVREGSVINQADLDRMLRQSMENFQKENQA